ncbi:MAG: 50S ribosomal protein L6 [Thermoguttaceae bacterium]
MSRLGKKPVQVPDGVKVHVADHAISVEGPLGKLDFPLHALVSVTHEPENRQILVSRRGETRQAKALHGLTRAMIQNMIIGVTQGYERRLEIVGVGYLAAVQQNVLQLRVGFANELQVPIPPGLNVSCPDQQHIVIRGIDKQKVSQFAANVRALRKPEPYKGKGIRYEGEVIRRKQSKAMAK